MLTLLKIAGLVFERFGSLLSDEFFWIIILILIMIYKKSSAMEIKMLGSSYPLFKKVLSSVLTGLAGGLTGSMLVILMGISIEDYTMAGEGSLTGAITYIWIIAVLLAMINPRYLCFSYAGGIIALMSLIFGFPKVYVPGLLALIGVLHLVESFLIWMDGYTYSVPLFLRMKDRRTVGGYMMNRIWPIPLVVFAVMFGRNGGGASFAGLIDMPSWWPFLKHSAAGGSRELIYLPIMLPVVLGYGDMAITSSPEKKCRSSAIRLGGYSLILIILSLAASKLKFFAYAAAVFAPLAHEMLIIYGGKEETEGEPCFAAGETGVKVLYVKKDSIAEDMGIKPGDTILRINGISIYSETQLAEFLGSCPVYIWIDVERPEHKVVTVEHTDYRNGNRSLGILVVPRNAEFYYEISSGGSIFKKLINRIRGKSDKGIDV